MSVLIKGFEMPESCDTCPLSKFDSTNEKFYCMFDNCHLVEVPTPHGRLIDVDKLLIDAPKYVDYPPHYEPKLLSILDVENAPTVIEAEEGEDGDK